MDHKEHYSIKQKILRSKWVWFFSNSAESAFSQILEPQKRLFNFRETISSWNDNLGGSWSAFAIYKASMDDSHLAVVVRFTPPLTTVTHGGNMHVASAYACASYRTLDIITFEQARENRLCNYVCVPVQIVCEPPSPLSVPFWIVLSQLAHSLWASMPGIVYTYVCIPKRQRDNSLVYLFWCATNDERYANLKNHGPHTYAKYTHRRTRVWTKVYICMGVFGFDVISSRDDKFRKSEYTTSRKNWIYVTEMKQVYLFNLND